MGMVPVSWLLAKSLFTKTTELLLLQNNEVHVTDLQIIHQMKLAKFCGNGSVELVQAHVTAQTSDK